MQKENDRKSREEVSKEMFGYAKTETLVKQFTCRDDQPGRRTKEVKKK